MFNISESKYVKVWDVEIKDRYVSADLSTSKKEKDGTYTNSNYKFCKFVGGCLNDAKRLQKGDSITILKGAIGKRKSKDGKIWDEVVIFSFEPSEGSAKVSQDDGFTQIEDDSDIPF